MSLASSNARALVAALVGAGVRDAVLAPGSRSAPLALAFAAAERAGLLRLHVRIDERSAGYLALGLARVLGTPVPVVTTSGTAAVNLHPAMVEASYGGVPLLALTADRPPALRGVGANQAIDQVALFGTAPRWSVDLVDVDSEVTAEVAHRAVAVATDRDFPGPVHLNLPYAEPLVEPVAETLRPVTPSVPAPEGPEAALPLTEVLPPGLDPARGLIVVGDLGGMGHLAQGVAALAEAAGWPVVAEPSSGCSGLSSALAHGPLLLADEEFAAEHVPDVVVTVGRVGLHRSVTRMLPRARCHLVVDPRPAGHVSDPTRTAAAVLPVVPTAGSVRADATWGGSWRSADAAAAAAVAGVLDVETEEALTGPVVARRVVGHLSGEDLLVVGPSFPVRHVSSLAGPVPGLCLGNRGTSGIDGVVSTAWGAALAHGGPAYALLGDLTALYDRNGLLVPQVEARPDLTYVVADNDGGGIFSSLEQGAPEYAADFERVFGTAHGGRLADLLAAPGVVVTEVDTDAGLRAALAEARVRGGVRVIVARCASRAAETEQLAAVQRAVTAR